MTPSDNSDIGRVGNGIVYDTRGVYIYQVGDEERWRWQVVVGWRSREGEESSFARARA